MKLGGIFDGEKGEMDEEAAGNEDEEVNEPTMLPVSAEEEDATNLKKKQRRSKGQKKRRATERAEADEAVDEAKRPKAAAGSRANQDTQHYYKDDTHSNIAERGEHSEMEEAFQVQACSPSARRDAQNTTRSSPDEHEDRQNHKKTHGHSNLDGDWSDGDGLFIETDEPAQPGPLSSPAARAQSPRNVKATISITQVPSEKDSKRDAAAIFKVRRL